MRIVGVSYDSDESSVSRAAIVVIVVPVSVAPQSNKVTRSGTHVDAYATDWILYAVLPTVGPSSKE